MEDYMLHRFSGVKRLFFILIPLCLLPVGAFAQIKNYVGIVREKYHSANIAVLEEYRDTLQSKGYTSYAQSIDSYLKGGFGSGFVYVAPDGTNYIITNRHVVSQAESVSVEFEGADGGTTKYDNLKVLNADEEIDLAILSFPKGVKPFKKGLTFATKKVQDGQEVWTAGFPGLAGNPLWQLGKGSVTNSTARIKDLVDPDITALIQHSAQIDGGNSGGPLLIADPSGEAGYAVVGVNTWKYVRRQDTNYSIPAAAVQAYITKVLNPENAPAIKTQVEKRVQSFIADAAKQDNDFTDIVKYISYAYVGSDGKDVFVKALSSAPSAVRSVVVAVFNNYSPLEGMRYALAWDVWKKLGNDERSLVSAGDVTEVSSVACTVPLQNEKWEKPIETRWISEHGLWRLEMFGSAQTKTEKGKKKAKTAKTDIEENSEAPFFSFESPYASALQISFDLSRTNDITHGFSASYSYFLDMTGMDKRWVGFGFALNIDKVTTLNVTRVIAGPVLTVQVPMIIGKTHLIPYIAGTVGPNILGFTSFDKSAAGGFAAGFETGLKAGYDFGTDVNVLIGVAYKYMQQKPLFDRGRSAALKKPSLSASLTLVF